MSPQDSRRQRWPQAARAAVRIPLRLVSGLATLVLTGTLLLMLPAMSPGPALPWNEAFFTAASALTVNGLTIIVPYSDLTTLGQAVLLLLIQVGGVGYMVLAVLALRFAGRHISIVDKLALRDALGLVSHQGILGLTYRVLGAVVLFEVIGTVLFWWHWRDVVPREDLLFYSVFHSTSAFCNAGFDLFHGRPDFPSGIPSDNMSLIVFGILIFLGSLGIPVLFDALTWYKRRQVSLHSKITVPLVLGLVFVGGAALVLSEGWHGGVLTDVPMGRRILMGIFHSVSARSGGFVGFEDVAALEPASLLTLTVLMFIGSSPASMGGGITTGTFAVLGLALLAYIRGWNTPRIGGRAIPGEMVRKGAAVLTVALFVVVGCTWLLLMTHPLTFEIALFEVTSAFSTCGMGIGLARDLNAFGQVLIVLVMAWGRLGALTIMVALTRTQRSQHLTLPEEKILIG